MLSVSSHCRFHSSEVWMRAKQAKACTLKQDCCRLDRVLGSGQQLGNLFDTTMKLSAHVFACLHRHMLHCCRADQNTAQTTHGKTLQKTTDMGSTGAYQVWLQHQLQCQCLWWGQAAFGGAPPPVQACPHPGYWPGSPCGCGGPRHRLYPAPAAGTSL